MDRRQWKEPCDEHIVAEGVHIERGAVVRITRGRQLLLYVQAGTVWLTQERDRRDIVADAAAGSASTATASRSSARWRPRT